MEELRITNANLLQGFDGALQLVFNIDGRFREQAKQTVSTALERLRQGAEVGVMVERIKRRRSSDANAYFHVLCSKIAEKIGLSMDEVKSNMVVNYGAPMYEVSIPSDADISAMWAYSRFIGENNGKAQYWLYKQTHTLNSGEMARLINGTIQEAQQLGIDTITPKELEEMERKWTERKTA